jgi:hypothetical protein
MVCSRMNFTLPLPLHLVVHEAPLRFEGLNDIADSKIRDGLYHVMAVSLLVASNAPYTNRPYTVNAPCGPICVAGSLVLKLLLFLRPLVAYLCLVPPASISCHTLRCVIYLTGLSVSSSSLILRAKRLFLLALLFSPSALLLCTWNATRIWRSHFQISRVLCIFKGKHARMSPRGKFEVIILSNKYRSSMAVAISPCVWAIGPVNYVNTINESTGSGNQ